jgi:chemotaxis protein MotB
MFMLLGCVPVSQHLALDESLKESQKKVHRYETEIQTLQTEITHCHQAFESFNARFNDEQQVVEKCLKDRKRLEAQNNYLKNINLQLTDSVKALSADLEKKRSVIQLQEKVISLLDDTKKTIEKSLKDQIVAQNIEIVEMHDQLKVIFIDKILFDSGSITINSEGQKSLLAMADSIREFESQNVVVEGHTDSVPVGAKLVKRFPSNWELSAARAAVVARYLQNKGGIQPSRLSARGYGQYRPVASNDTEEGRRQNRRIEIILGATQ